MLRLAQLIDGASNAFGHLFAAYIEERHKQDRFVAEIQRELTGVPIGPFEASLRRSQSDTLNALGACIALIADNIARLYAAEAFGDEQERRKHGRIIKDAAGRNTTTFGTVLWAAANAARHYGDEPFRPTTEAVIAAFGIEERDESLAYQLLEIAEIRSKNDITNDLDVIFGSMDHLVWRQKQAGS